MTNLTRSRNQLWEDLLTNLEGSGSALTMSEEELIAAVRNTYGGSVSAKTLSRPKLLASLVNAAGGSASAATHSEDEMLALLATALGASDWSALTKSGLQSLAEAVSQSSEGGGGGEAPEPLAILDFVTGSYFAGGSSRAVTDLLGDDAEPGTTFTTDDIIPGSGLRGLSNGGSSLPSYIGPLLSDILGTAGCSMLFEVTLPEDDPVALSIICGINLFNSPTWDADILATLGEDDNGDLTLSATHGPAGNIIDVDPVVGPYVVGTNRFAITVEPDRLAGSLNGGDAVEVIAPVAVTWADYTKAYVGNTFDASYIRSIKVYAPQDDATLKLLSALD